MHQRDGDFITGGNLTLRSKLNPIVRSDPPQKVILVPELKQAGFPEKSHSSYVSREKRNVIQKH